MRGKVRKSRLDLVRKGITPAYAGKRMLTASRCPEQKDHPRLCGKKLFAAPFFSVLSGSPPPMRGKAGTADTLSRRRRITPAYAGKRL